MLSLTGCLWLALTPAAMDDPPLTFSGKAEGGHRRVLDVALTLRRNDDCWVGSIDLPLFGLQGYSLSEVVIEGARLKAWTSSGLLSIDADIQEDWKRLRGTLEQGQQSFQLDLSLDADYKYQPLRRPQTPQRPFPYRERLLHATHPDGHRLAGTLTLPDEELHGEGPYPTAVLISGGGQEDRDCTALGHKFFLVIADYLTRRGIAVMRFDDRGVGGSQTGENTAVGKFATSLELSTDTAAVVDLLRKVPEVDSSLLGLVGHSEGGLIAPLVHEADAEIAFMVLMAGPCVPGAEVFRAQVERAWRRDATDQAAVDALVTSFVAFQELLAGDAAANDVETAVRQLAHHSVAAGLHDNLDPEQRLQAAERSFAGFDAPWWRFMFGYDPEDALTSARCPVLAINGTLDVQVDCEQNLGALEELLGESDDTFETVRYEGLNHLFQPAVTGFPDEYAGTDITIDERVLRDLANWILDVSSR